MDRCRKCHRDLSARLGQQSLHEIEAQLLKHETAITARHKARSISPLCESCLDEWLQKYEKAHTVETDLRSPAIKRLDAACQKLGESLEREQAGLQ